MSDGDNNTEYVASIEGRLEALRMSLLELEGKVNKKERSIVTKEIFKLENDDRYMKIRQQLQAKIRAAEAAVEVSIIVPLL